MPIGSSGAGRALKTKFVLDYMAEPTLRAKVQWGLLKVEQLHARCVSNCVRGHHWLSRYPPAETCH